MFDKNEVFNFSKEFEEITVMFDGSCQPRNPNGDMGFGWCIYGDGEIIAEGWGYELYNGVKTTTNNIAEWIALHNGLKLLETMCIGYKKLYIKGDSKLVINQASGYWKINSHGAYYPYAKECMREYKDILKEAKLSHVYREQNEYCDDLSNRFVCYPHY